MTAYNSLIIIVIGLLVMALSSLAIAEDDVTIVSAPAKTSSAKKSTADKDKPSSGTSSRRKKTATKSTAAAKSTETKKPDRAPAIVSSPAPTAPPPSARAASTARPASTPPLAPVAKAKSQEEEPAAPAPKIPPAAASAAAVTTALAGSSGSPAVETGLPVARRSLIDPGPITATPSAGSTSIQSAPPNPKSNVSPYPGVTPAPTTVAMSAYRSSSRAPTEDFVFAETGNKRKNVYPWKTNIWTTKFWIGEGGSTISPTANIDSAWVQDWRGENGGTDSPTYRNGYASGSHAARTNPFYVALPFNDLVYPEKARRYLPASWYRKPKDGKAVSWCKDRWVQIKNRQGRSCYAQWEDVGPLRTDHAEYVFGTDRPTREYSQAGLDISPAVAQYLGIDSGDFTSWRFVDEEDVRPGEWLKYDELALIYKAMHEMKNSTSTDRRRNDDNDDDSNDDSNKKRVGAAKG